MQFYFLYRISLTLGHYVNKCSICSSVKPIDSYVCQQMCCNIKQHHKAHAEKVFRLGHPQPHLQVLEKNTRYNHLLTTQDKAHTCTTAFHATRVTTPTLTTQARTHTTTPSFLRILTRLLPMETLSHSLITVNIYFLSINSSLIYFPVLL